MPVSDQEPNWTGMQCCLWWKDQWGKTKFELFESYGLSLTRICELRKTRNTILGIQHSDGSLSTDDEIIAPDLPSPPLVEIRDPFTDSPVRMPEPAASTIPEWVGKRGRSDEASR